MWCPQCRQDVPGIASGPTAKLCCVRCRTPVERNKVASGIAGDLGGTKSTADGLPNEVDIAAHMEALERLSSWDFGEELSSDGWPPAAAEDSEAEVSAQRLGLLDAAHAELRGWHRSGAHPAPSGMGLLRVGRKPLAGWLLLSCGLASFFCGATLLTWSLFTNRPDLWTLGVPITLAGQVGLLLGVVLALDRLGHQNRQTVDRLGRLDERLSEIRAAAWLSSGSPNQTASSDSLRELFP